MVDEAAKIDRLIEVMIQLKELEDIYKTDGDVLIVGLMMALIRSTKIPDVTILTNNITMAQA
tara:strand:+ start:124 stop:309 length:186 start_codon:yes stop_codon:yes gene_type:complete